MSDFVERIARGAGLKPKAADAASNVVEQLFGGLFEGRSEAGEFVTPEKALGLPAVFRAIRLISEPAGALPAHVYAKRSGERERDERHPAYDLIHDQPNPEQSAVEFWTMLFAHLVGWGRLYIGKQLRGGKIDALWPIEPRKVLPERLPDGRLVFHEHRDDGSTITWRHDQIIYARLFTVDGVNGLSPIGLQRETMGLSIAMRKHASRFFRDLAVPPGVLELENEIRDPDTKERIRKEWKARHQASGDIAVLDAGAKFKTLSIAYKDAQFVELAGMTKGDIADAFNLPRSLLGAPTGDSMTYGNRESDMQQYLTFTLHNPLKKVEQALSLDRDLFPRRQNEPRTHFVEFLREDLLQPDSKARANFYRLALDPKSGWMNRDEVRQRENLPAEGDGAAQLRRAVENAQHATNGNHHPEDVKEPV